MLSELLQSFEAFSRVHGFCASRGILGIILAAQLSLSFGVLGFSF